MILADTNILIDYIKSLKGKNIFLSEEIAICGVIEAELLHGARSKKEVDLLSKAISAFTFLEIESSDWKKIGLLLMNLRMNGIAVPLADAIIAFLAAKNNVALWTNDSHFSMIKTCLPELNLFNP